jgi:NADH-quinone oxidoreductase subunit N
MDCLYGSPNTGDSGEYYVLCLFSILGMMILVSSSSFLSLYLGLELFALPIYALVAFVKKQKEGAEAAMKYFVVGAMASAMLLYGVSLLYGMTGTFEIAKMAEQLSTQPTIPPLAISFGLMFVIVGLAFKWGAVPFHMWLPDVYQGAPSSVTLFIGTLPKLAAFGMAMRILVDAFPALHLHWEPLLLVLSFFSLALGNIVAIAQTNIKRMLAYSTIGHVGFLFLGLLAGPTSGYSAALLYTIIYALMALGGFGIIVVLSHKGFEAENIADFKGLAVREPLIAFMMMLVLLSLTGIPPLAGFYAKFLVLDALVNAGYVSLAAIALMFSVIGAYYYLRVIKMMYFDDPIEGWSHIFNRVSFKDRALISLNGALLLLLGIFPAYLWNICVNAMKLS